MNAIIIKLFSIGIAFSSASVAADVCFRASYIRSALEQNVGKTCGVIDRQDLAKVTYLDLSRRNIKVLNSEDFAGLDGLKALRLTDNEIHRLQSGVFALLRSLERLDLSHNPLDLIDENAFAGLDKLTSIEAGGTSAKTLPTNLLVALPELNSFSFYNGKLNRIDPNFFQGNPKLTSINLAANNLKEVPGTLFRKSPGLTSALLFSNKISKVPADLFEGLPSLIRVRLDNNRIQQLPAGIFKNLPSVNRVYISNNQIENLDEDLFRELPNLAIVYAQNNRLREVPVNLFRVNSNLTEVSFSNNLLTSLPDDIFRTNVRIRTLDLYENKIEKLPPDLLTGLSDLLMFHAQDNRIAAIPDNFFGDSKKLEIVNLDNNPIRALSARSFDSHLRFEKLMLLNSKLSADARKALSLVLGGKVEFDLKTPAITFTQVQGAFPAQVIYELAQNKFFKDKFISNKMGTACADLSTIADCRMVLFGDQTDFQMSTSSASYLDYEASPWYSANDQESDIFLVSRKLRTDLKSDEVRWYEGNDNDGTSVFPYGHFFETNLGFYKPISRYVTAFIRAGKEYNQEKYPDRPDIWNHTSKAFVDHIYYRSFSIDDRPEKLVQDLYGFQTELSSQDLKRNLKIALSIGLNVSYNPIKSEYEVRTHNSRILWTEAAAGTFPRGTRKLFFTLRKAAADSLVSPFGNSGSINLKKGSRLAVVMFNN